MKGFKKQKDDSNMNIHRGILGCVFVGCEGPCRDGSCNPCVCSHGNGSIWGVQWMEEVAHGRPRYLCSWENIPRDCVWEMWALTDEFKEDFWSIQEKLLHPNQDLQQAGFRLSGQPWMWNPTSPTSSQRNHTFSSSSHNTNLTNHIHLTHQAIAILHWWDDTAHHCCSVNLLGLGMTHIACLPPDPTVHVAWS